MSACSHKLVGVMFNVHLEELEADVPEVISGWHIVGCLRCRFIGKALRISSLLYCII